MSLTTHRRVFPPETVIDPEQVRMAAAGNRLAAQQLMATIRPLVLCYCRTRMRGSWITGEDIAQETCLALLAALPSYDESRGTLVSLAYGIARHLLATTYRQAGRRPATSFAEMPDMPAPEAGPEEQAVQRDQFDRLAPHLTSLSVRQQQVVLLRVMHALSAEETAVAIDSTAGSVRVAQHRALQRLRTAVLA